MERNEHYTLNSASHIYGTKWALHIEESNVYFCNEMSTTHWIVQVTIMVRNEHYTLKSAMYIYGTKWALHSEQCKVHVWYEMSTAHWTV